MAHTGTALPLLCQIVVITNIISNVYFMTIFFFVTISCVIDKTRQKHFIFLNADDVLLAM
jgi:hypothetical protein